ncbi:MAG: hypothetical protein JW772_03155 [Candidatus Diapherotrites archaeon]|nr:hypothetical protein [Candidatus Diapherotrites archaeon]
MGDAEFPESGLVRKSYVIRQMDLPPSVKLTKRSLLRWFALSFGLISSGESRSTVLLVLEALFTLLLTSKKNPSTIEIQSFIKEKFQKKISEKLIRYHLNRLIDSGLLVRRKARYYLNNNPYAEPDNLHESFNHWIKQPVNNSMNDISEVLMKLTDAYRK